MERIKELILDAKDNQVLDLLHQNQELITKVDSDNRTILHLAVASKSVFLVKQLLDRFPSLPTAHQDNYGWTPLHLAASLGSLPLVELLLPVCPPTLRSQGGQTALHYAAGKGHLAVVERLLGAATIKDEMGQTALHRAATLGRTEIVASLVGGAPEILNWIDSEGKTAISLAKEEGHQSTVNCLLELGADTTIAE